MIKHCILWVTFFKSVNKIIVVMYFYYNLEKNMSLVGIILLSVFHDNIENIVLHSK